MGNTTDDPMWTSFIYHDRVWWFFRRQLSGGKALQPALRKALSCLDHALAKIMNLPPKDFRELGVGSFVYAALFLTEGIGLWLAKPWAEWFTIIITGSLVPLELYEIYHHPTVAKVVVLLLNVAVVVYLIIRVRKERSELA